MKTYILLLIFTIVIGLFPSQILAQEGKITYRAYSGKLAIASPPNENGYPNEYEIEKATLYFSASKSLYIQDQNKVVVQFISSPNGTERIEVPRNNLDPYGTVFFLDFLTQEQYARESFWNKSTFANIKEEILPIEWKITDEKKIIGKYASIKATATILGRDWEAWFTPEIQVPFGPWRLNGLPGLILEAHDSTLDFMYHLSSVDIPHAFTPHIDTNIVFSGKLLSRSEFDNENLTKKEKYISYMKSVALENDGKVEIRFYPQIDLSAKSLKK
ncbi:GLPGLI family protein [Cecembia lonarensis]|uniref:GLPGLI family protein n=1 Tax=Cecembia lonarensis (strain CCUG 58316 / KCTC 22772 / LW9) TaxID=1225176 RepID=K1L5L3_CECL9|nr:GLPGLI family protein [Cecembia lonarensis]EKB50066.1 GLPGLI family protein [Cecembia lonarensis LW9]